jgi:membrane associated rhomboid family serine protease
MTEAANPTRWGESASDPQYGGPAGSAAAPLARCYRHPMRETGVRCVRCNRPICPECMRPASVGFHCPDDVKLGTATVRQPLTAVGARARNRIPLVTGTLIGLNVAVYLVTAVTTVRGFNHPEASSLFEKWQLQPERVASSDEFYRLLTSAFLHVSVLHILFNMAALAIIGPYLERLLGPWRFAAVYLLAALGGSVAVYAFGSRYTPVAGASGAIFGLFGAALLLVRELGLDRQWLIATIVLNFAFTFAVADISKLGHLGGFVVGCLATVAIAGPSWRARRRLPVQTQLIGLCAVLVLLIGVIVWRSLVI